MSVTMRPVTQSAEVAVNSAMTKGAPPSPGAGRGSRARPCLARQVRARHGRTRGAARALAVRDAAGAGLPAGQAAGQAQAAADSGDWAAAASAAIL